MASIAFSAPAPAQQPDLRSFIVCDKLPKGCFAHSITNNACLPHLRPGDIAIVDPDDCEPAAGELFIYELMNGDRRVVEAWLVPMHAGCGPNNEMIDTHCWMVGACNRPRTREAILSALDRGMEFVFCDGPFATEGPHAGALQKNLRGKIVGILEPVFREPLRIAA